MLSRPTTKRLGRKTTLSTAAIHVGVALWTRIWPQLLSHHIVLLQLITRRLKSQHTLSFRAILDTDTHSRQIRFEDRPREPLEDRTAVNTVVSLSLRAESIFRASVVPPTNSNTALIFPL